MEDVKIPMTKEEGMATQTTPSGRKVSVVRVGETLWGFRLDGVGQQPVETSELFTSYVRSEKAMFTYLERFWNVNEKAKQKQRRNNHDSKASSEEHE
jgi:hypothetical protein